MKEFKTLLERFWLRREDFEIFTKTKRAYGTYKQFAAEQLGWKIISNEKILKLEKIPAHAEAFMGIQGFTGIRDYCILCALLIFLEDREDNEQFLLSELVEQIEIHLKEVTEVDWTQFVQRKSLIRALQYGEKMGMMTVYEGDSSQISGGMDQEVLYENTGLSRYFAATFDYDVTGYQTYRDFEEMAVGNMETDRGYLRVNRVYRQLVTSPAMYWESADDADSLYLKNQRPWVKHYLEQYIGGALHIHKNAAFFVMEGSDSFGTSHPRDAMLPELVLLFCREIRQETEDGVLTREKDDTVWMETEHFSRLLSACKEKYGVGWSKEYREMSQEKLEEEVAAYMENWMMLRRGEGQYKILPGAAKLAGRYPRDFKTKAVDTDEQ